MLNQGSDVAFINGVVKSMFAHDWVDRDFLDGHTVGFEELRDYLAGVSWESIESATGLGREEMEEFAEVVGRADRAVFVWSMGITQHEFGVDNVRAIVNLSLTKGFVGRKGCGLMPIRGHSGVQGGAEMGAYSTAFPGGVPVNAKNAEALGEQWGFPVPDAPGFMTAEMLEAADRGELDALFSVGGNFLEVMPDPRYVESALGRIPLRVHVDIVLTKQMFIESGETVILLPATTRYEIPGGVTQTSTERRIMFSPEIPGRRIGEARPEWEVFLDLARRVRPEIAEKLRFESTAEIREEIARVVPFYDGIQGLAEKGDQFQYGGAHLCADWNFGTADGKAHFSVVETRGAEIPKGYFAVSTRRGKQFNSMVQEDRDSTTGAYRDSVLMNGEDAAGLDFADGDAVVLENEHGSFRGRIHFARIAKRHVQIHWPEGNVLIDRGCRSPEAGVPDYNALVRIVKAG
jgi:molybdopterin-dependent oxidoreductase alpha subunit